MSIISIIFRYCQNPLSFGQYLPTLSHHSSTHIITITENSKQDYISINQTNIVLLILPTVFFLTASFSPILKSFLKLYPLTFSHKALNQVLYSSPDRWKPLHLSENALKKLLYYSSITHIAMHCTGFCPVSLFNFILMEIIVGSYASNIISSPCIACLAGRLIAPQRSVTSLTAYPNMTEDDR